MQCILCNSNKCNLIYKKRNADYFRCTCCDLVFLAPSMRVSEEAEYARYQKHENSLANYGYKSFFEKFLSQVEERMISSFSGLDYGSGKEEFLRELLAARGIAVSSYDLYFFSEKDALSRSYDFILCSEACEHFREPFSEFHRLAALLKPSAWMALRTEFVPDDFAAWYYHRDPTHIAFYSEKSFAWIAACFGLTIELCQSPYVVLKKA